MSRELYEDEDYIDSIDPGRETVEIMVAFQEGGIFYHARIHSIVIDGLRFDAHNKRWDVYTKETPYQFRTLQQKLLGAVPRLVPSV